ncbi:hypothetical protein I79_003746 [Cricetulus griseus]|uniref:Uncharacterized protein n=1 Tax=Cricetulus griseus TaxID=10029 RepID=G3H0S8_CRIGR|nr:hypothetical protein I79_003746 [Cricetulus griseus]
MNPTPHLWGRPTLPLCSESLGAPAGKKQERSVPCLNSQSETGRIHTAVRKQQERSGGGTPPTPTASPGDPALANPVRKEN